MGSWQPRNFDQLLMMKLKINQNLFNNFFSKSVLSITQQHSPGRFVSLLFSLGYSTISRNYERNNMFSGRCKLSRPGSQWGGKRLPPFPQTNILFTGYEGKKKSASEASRAVVCGTPFLPPFPPPSLRSLVPGQCKLQTCGGVPVFLGTFRSWEGGGGGQGPVRPRQFGFIKKVAQLN